MTKNEAIQNANESFFEKAETSLRALFDLARSKNELHFALSLNPEFRGCQDPGWNTAHEARIAFDQYIFFLKQQNNDPIKTRIALSFYCHMAEAAGYYEIPKNMMRVAEGDLYNLWPFQDIVKRAKSGSIIAPNTNKITRNLSAHATDIGLSELTEVFKDTFDSDVRNGYAHADYILWEDGIRLRKRNGGQPRIVSYDEFTVLLNRAVGFFDILRHLVKESLSSFDPPKKVRGRMNNEPEGTWTIHCDRSTGAYKISGGPFGK